MPTVLLPSGEKVEVSVKIEARSYTRCVFLELAAELSPTFVRLAKGDEAKTNQFNGMLADGLEEWSGGIFVRQQIVGSIASFNNIQQTATALCTVLKKLDDYGTAVLQDALAEGPNADVSKLCDALSALAIAAGKAGGLMAAKIGHQAPRGRRKGTKEYFNLGALVYYLEFAAQHADGRFTYDKLNRKGSVVQALDLLKLHLDRKLEWKRLSEFLPRPGRHPLSMYEREITRARTEVARIRSARE